MSTKRTTVHVSHYKTLKTKKMTICVCLFPFLRLVKIFKTYLAYYENSKM